MASAGKTRKKVSIKTAPNKKVSVTKRKPKIVKPKTLSYRQAVAVYNDSALSFTGDKPSPSKSSVVNGSWMLRNRAGETVARVGGKSGQLY